MPPDVLIGGGLSLVGGKMESDAAKDAAGIQAGAADRATALQKQQYDQARADQEPWRQAGVKALSGMQDADYMRDFTAADFTKDPGYDFRMAEGQKALERSAAARGGILSGGALKGISRYGQDFASNEYGNAYNRFNADRDRRFGRLSNLAGMGQTANAANQQGGQYYAGAAGENMMGAANAQAAGRVAGTKAWTNSLSNIGNMYSKSQENLIAMAKMAGGGK